MGNFVGLYEYAIKEALAEEGKKETKHDIDDSLFYCDSGSAGSIIYRKTCDICVDRGVGRDDECKASSEHNGQVIINL